MKCNIHLYQDFSVNWILREPFCGLFLDMGLGKTLSTLTAVDYLFKFGQIKKVLVVAPLNVAKQTWSDEVEKWDHLQHLSYSKIIGPPATRLKALEVEADIHIINVDILVWLIDLLGKNWPYDMVVIDELSGFKNNKSKRFRALRKIRPKIKRFVGLTGTPAPNNLLDLWPQMYLIDKGERLEKTITNYRRKYFVPDQMNGHIVFNYRVIPGAEEIIYDKISDVTVSMKKRDHLKMPDVTKNIIKIPLTPKEQKLYKEFERDYVMTLDETDITASNAAVLSNKLLQLANGAIYDDEGQYHIIHDAKLEALGQIVQEAQGEPILLLYSYKHDLERIQLRFKQAKLLDVDAGDIDKWNAGEIPILLAHPKSAGHGLNLQKGGHIIVWFGMTWSLEAYQQANARLDRQGQTHPVVIHHLITENSTDEVAMLRLEGKDENQEALLEYIKAKIEEAAA